VNLSNSIFQKDLKMFNGRGIMRNEKEMLDLILDFANEDERIRAVILNGSLANPNAPRDKIKC
jgi:hypothetical protein